MQVIFLATVLASVSALPATNRATQWRASISAPSNSCEGDFFQRSSNCRVSRDPFLRHEATLRKRQYGQLAYSFITSNDPTRVTGTLGNAFGVGGLNKAPGLLKKRQFQQLITAFAAVDPTGLVSQFGGLLGGAPPAAATPVKAAAPAPAPVKAAVAPKPVLSATGQTIDLATFIKANPAAAPAPAPAAAPVAAPAAAVNATVTPSATAPLAAAPVQVAAAVPVPAPNAIPTTPAAVVPIAVLAVPGNATVVPGTVGSVTPAPAAVVPTPTTSAPLAAAAQAVPLPVTGTPINVNTTPVAPAVQTAQLNVVAKAAAPASGLVAPKATA